ncbi:MAG: FeoA family protein [Bacillota bacterium]
MPDIELVYGSNGARRLSEMVVGQAGTVAFLARNNPRLRKKLAALGLLPGTPVRLLQRFPSYLIQAGRTQFVLDAELAREIWVKPEGER